MAYEREQREGMSCGWNLEASSKAKCCTDSRECIRIGEEGFHMREQYSSWGADKRGVELDKGIYI